MRGTAILIGSPQRGQFQVERPKQPGAGLAGLRKEFPDQARPSGATAIGQESELANAHETTRQKCCRKRRRNSVAVRVMWRCLLPRA